ncbi:hypothetical protein [Gordonia neofelifaecis]|uniref:Uncharacterized protein n=1 Tax=Gordonia neofelifaecis NRRL B-59395 TaxID=644548 RepID=F1YE71_9ACTN|nr:hypothetical protein [Gordonia neofelifaecis]EGD57161.1 hypothetical protein SCNU_02265 [Gordonia neofelifaecis NRRL B-59395]
MASKTEAERARERIDEDKAADIQRLINEGGDEAVAKKYGQGAKGTAEYRAARERIQRQRAARQEQAQRREQLAAETRKAAAARENVARERARTPSQEPAAVRQRVAEGKGAWDKASKAKTLSQQQARKTVAQSM